MAVERSIIQVVPRRTSVPDGIGDYAVLLAEGLRARHGLSTTFLAGTPPGLFPPANDTGPVTEISARTSETFLATITGLETKLTPVAIVLHVAGYGYAQRGAPVWLLHGLRSWRQRSDTRLVAVFHELYARGRPWQSSFWLSRLQKWVAKEIWALADCGLTSNSRYLDELNVWQPHLAKRLILMPVVSNVGEPTKVPGIRARPPRAVVFGSAGLEQTLYKEQRAALEEFVAASGIEQIVDIGSRNDPPPETVGPARVLRLGRQPAAAISVELMRSRFGLLVYDAGRLGKSTVYAALATHGVIPVCFASADEPSDGLKDGVHLLRSPFASLSTERLDLMQLSVRQWYAGHSSELLIDRVAGLCRRPPQARVGGQPS